jgi:hypothetical protein
MALLVEGPHSMRRKSESGARVTQEGLSMFGLVVVSGRVLMVPWARWRRVYGFRDIAWSSAWRDVLPAHDGR